MTEISCEDFSKYLSERLLGFISELGLIEFEDGMDNDALIEVRTYARDDYDLTLDWLYSIYEKCKGDDGYILSGLIRIIADIVNVADQSRFLPIITSGLTHKSGMVQEASIMVIEEWRTKECLDALSKVSFSSFWIKDYAGKVKEELEKELRVI